MFDIIIGNRERVKDSTMKNSATQTEELLCATRTKPQAREARRQASLKVTSSDELLSSTDVVAAQSADPTLANIPKIFAKGVGRKSTCVTARFHEGRGKPSNAELECSEISLDS